MKDRWYLVSFANYSAVTVRAKDEDKAIKIAMKSDATQKGIEVISVEELHPKWRK